MGNVLLKSDTRAADNRMEYDSHEMREFASFLRNPQTRDMTTDPSSGGDLIPQGFRDQLAAALKQYDRLFDPDVVMRIDADNGRPLAIPIIDDTASAATVVAQGALTPFQDATAGQLLLAEAATYRSGYIRFSVELLQDSAFDPVQFLAAAFAVRFGRGIGPALVTALLAAATVGAKATGDPNATESSGATSIGYQDLLALRLSVNAAYRASEKVWWVMNDNTLTALDGLLDKNGRPIFRPHLDANGSRMIMGYPVAICPSMPSIAASATPVAFGATGYFVVRTGAMPWQFKADVERFADYGQVGFQALLRANSGLLVASGGDTPVKLLQNAASS